MSGRFESSIFTQISFGVVGTGQKWSKFLKFSLRIQSGRCSLAKHGDAYFLAVYGFMKDPIAAPGPCENQEF